MFHLLYVSVAKKPCSDAALLSLLTQARRSNLGLGITGFLLYQPDAFMQVLEGEEAAVRGLYGLIRHDVRHHDVVALVAKTILTRQFSDWSMGFRRLQSEEFRPVVEDGCPKVCPATYWTRQGGSAALDLLESCKGGE